MDAVEFPVTLPNQPKVQAVIDHAKWVYVVASLAVGLATNSLPYTLYTFLALVAATIVAVGPNWPWFKSEPSIEWLQVRI
ncbi:uncharacterized protein CANTADRAFT_90847 [Suhomyces tanzawaensis NRRL Y-17324]|uniref:Uncharacterized protein n=1 Tax=Suhomyces tanzawaensis NRRL Y-17324 TaxID=984487 RepID=A0A1E4SG87_9ASCO|nr:uncharacterized protein CANTADRAFT_90847 [Suhomyces tanzawaensis NRRL Y-17324]ODV78523.1 hypothetical protein CANTADRAFT_90847 [Suhomyces tanzawaensis NRRL Y-17324]